MEENIWKFWDKNYNTYDEYIDSTPASILSIYGDALKIDTEGLLLYSINQDYLNKNTPRSIFYCVVPKDENVHKYVVRFFEVSHNVLNIYPCKFVNSLTKKSYTCNSVEELKKNIEIEINSKEIKSALSKLINRFYDNETIKKITEN
jgi:hypothetical protein